MSIIMPAFIWPDYSAMQWPCPSGFHIPSKDEWATLCWILTTTFWLSSNSTTIGTYLKMPKAGRRYRSDGSYGAGDAYYWSASYYSTNQAYYLYSETYSLSPQSYTYRADAFSIRSFKDTPEIPTPSWSILYDWSGVASGAWIFWSSTDWLISVSWDWTTWTTIADKNLWATTVYNYGDTLSDANCGNFYQWWNNYWFPRSWTVTTSSTQVDASSYWPWNYYNSSTFIKWFIDWSSVGNNNLRWGVTWVVTNTWELKKRYVWVEWAIIDFLLVWGWGGWYRSWWGGWAVCTWTLSSGFPASYTIVVWSWWAKCWWDWGNSSIWDVVAAWGKWWVNCTTWSSTSPTLNHWGDSWSWCAWWLPYANCTTYSRWGWGGAWWIWGDATGVCNWGDWWEWIYWYGWWWWAAGKCDACAWDWKSWWWNWTYCNTRPTSATNCWWWWGWAFTVACSWVWACWVVDVCYACDWSYWIHSATWWDSCYLCWDICVHRFTSNWTFTINS